MIGHLTCFTKKELQQMCILCPFLKKYTASQMCLRWHVCTLESTHNIIYTLHTKNTPLRHSFSLNYFCQTQYWSSLRFRVGDFGLAEILNPAVTAGSTLQPVTSFVSLLLSLPIFPSLSGSNGPQKVIPGARLLLLGLMGTLGEVGQLLWPSGVTTTEGIVTLRSGWPM